jgi:hypothetical protein
MELHYQAAPAGMVELELILGRRLREGGCFCLLVLMWLAQVTVSVAVSPYTDLHVEEP